MWCSVAEIVEVATFRGIGEDGGRRSPSRRRPHRARQRLRHDRGGRACAATSRVNALYYDIADFRVRDYVGGMQDLQDRVLRLIGDPGTRYREDPVRMLRAARLAAKLEFTSCRRPTAPFETLGPLLAEAPPARLFDESLKMFLSRSGAEKFPHAGTLRLAEVHVPGHRARARSAVTRRCARWWSRAWPTPTRASTRTSRSRRRSCLRCCCGARCAMSRRARWRRACRCGRCVDDGRRPRGGRTMSAGGDPAPLHLHHGGNLGAAAALRTIAAQARVPADGASALSRGIRFPVAACGRVAGDWLNWGNGGRTRNCSRRRYFPRRCRQARAMPRLTMPRCRCRTSRRVRAAAGIGRPNRARRDRRLYRLGQQPG